MPRTLFLHIGAHKTGTSAIQRACLAARRGLRRQGWQVAEQPKGPPNWGNGFEMSSDSGRITITAPTLAAIRARLAGGTQNAVLSAEDLFFLEEDEIARFAGAVCGGFDRVRILAYLRRQDELAVSQKAQAAKSIKAGDFFGLDHDRLPALTPMVRAYLSFDAKLAAWQRAFPEAEMILRVYDRRAFPAGNVVADFATLLGADIPGIGEDANPTLGANAVRLLVDLRAAGASPDALKHVIRSDMLEPDPTRFLPTRTAARDFVAGFAASNRALEAAHGIRFHDDFSRYPETPGDDGFAAYEQRNLLRLQRFFRAEHVGDGPIRQRRALCEAMARFEPKRQAVRSLLFGR